jgi:hypothetical protein
MTQAFNLSQFANKVNTSGEASLTTAVTGTLPVANGGTGITSAGSNGNVLTSNGTAWVSSAPPSSAPTTAQVLTATAGASANDVGSYVLAGTVSGTGSVAANTTIAGSGLVYFGLINNSTGQGWQNVQQSPSGTGTSGTLSGTWRAMGNGVRPSGYGAPATLFLRIS